MPLQLAEGGGWMHATSGNSRCTHPKITKVRKCGYLHMLLMAAFEEDEATHCNLSSLLMYMSIQEDGGGCFMSRCELLTVV